MPDIQSFIQNLLLRAPGILFGITIHEYAHGLVALLRGDRTAQLAGRLTLNPIAHLDPIGTLMLCFSPFGWAKPVPVDFRNLKNPARDVALVGAAGPLSNILCAGAIGFILQFFILNMVHVPFSEYVFPILTIAYQINIGLSFFNLLPIPPLDGSNILLCFLPRSRIEPYLRLMQYIPAVFFALIIIEWATPVKALSLVFNPLYVPYASFWHLIIFGGRM
jgi:Zn-dependent protease